MDPLVAPMGLDEGTPSPAIRLIHMGGSPTCPPSGGLNRRYRGVRDRAPGVGLSRVWGARDR